MLQPGRIAHNPACDFTLEMESHSSRSYRKVGEIKKNCIIEQAVPPKTIERKCELNKVEKRKKWELSAIM